MIRRHEKIDYIFQAALLSEEEKSNFIKESVSIRREQIAYIRDVIASNGADIHLTHPVEIPQSTNSDHVSHITDISVGGIYIAEYVSGNLNTICFFEYVELSDNIIEQIALAVANEYSKSEK